LKHTIYNTFSTINKEDWNAITTSNIYLDVRFLQSLENSVDEVKQFFYVIYYENNKPIGKSVFQLLTFDISKYENLDSIPCKVSNKLITKILPKNIYILVCGNIFVTGENAFVFNDNYDENYIFNAIDTVSNTIKKQHNNIKYILFKEFKPNSAVNQILTEQYGYHHFNIDVNMVLNINNNWDNLSSVLADFRTKYRSRANNVLKKSNNITVHELDLASIEKFAKRMEYLYNSVINKSNFNIGVFNFETFYLLKKNLLSKYKIFGYFLEDKLIGFNTLFHSNGFVDASFIGLDYEYVEANKLYQRILLDYVEYAVTNKSKVLSLGRTAETIKCCVGAVPVNMDLFIKTNGIISNAILKAIMRNITPTEFSLRNPFKDRKTQLPESLQENNRKGKSTKLNSLLPKFSICK